MIDEAQIEAAVHWLRESAAELAAARADRHYLDKYEHAMLATLQAEHKEKSLGAQQREAYIDPRYIAWLDKYRAAVHREELVRAKRDAAINMIEYWRSWSANTRGRL